MAERAYPSPLPSATERKPGLGVNHFDRGAVETNDPDRGAVETNDSDRGAVETSELDRGAVETSALEAHRAAQVQ